MSAEQDPSALTTDIAALQAKRDELTSAIATKQAILLDLETRRICAQSHAVMIQLDAASDLDARAYSRWGRRIGAYVTASLRS